MGVGNAPGQCTGRAQGAGPTTKPLLHSHHHHHRVGGRPEVLFKAYLKTLTTLSKGSGAFLETLEVREGGCLAVAEGDGSLMFGLENGLGTKPLHCST